MSNQPLVITCKTCGRVDVPDWGDGRCITCARDAVLEHPAHDNQGSQPPYAPAAAHDTPEQRLDATIETTLIQLYKSAMLHGEAQANHVLPSQHQREDSVIIAKAAILAAVASSRVEPVVDTPELRALMAENKRLIEAGDALYERASYTGREFDGTHRLVSAAAHWLDVRGKNSGEYQASLQPPTKEAKG
jgi:hypothetical protein